MKTCPNCHFQLSDEAIHCGNCGAQQAEAAAKTQTAYNGSSQTMYNSTNQNRTGNNFTWEANGATQARGIPPVNRNVFLGLLFTFLTCGLYGFFWIYVIAKDLNNLLGFEVVNPGYAVASCLFSPLMGYTMYNVDRAMTYGDRLKGRYSEGNFLMWIILLLVCGIGFLVMMVQAQNWLNEQSK